MCGRVRIKRIDEIDAFYAGLLPDFEEFSEIKIDPSLAKPRYNVAPSQMVPIVRLNAEDKGTIRQAKWGLIPSWTKAKPKLAPINARCETAATSGMFRQALDRRRCLIPADGFYEWKGAKPPKQPYFIHRKDDALFSFAGLWERWKPDPGAEPIDTFTILTTGPNSLMADLHNRMPVILDDKDYPRWLDRSVPGKEVADLLKPYPSELMEAWPVSTRVNSPKNEGPDLAEKVDVAT